MKKQEKQEKKPSFFRSHPEVKGLLLFGLSIVMFLSLASFDPASPRENWLGLVGFSIGFSLTYLLGLGSFLFTGFISHVAIKLISKGSYPHLRSKSVYGAIFLLSCCLLLNLIAETKCPFPELLAAKTPIETIVLDLPYPQMHIRQNLGGVPLYYLYRDLPTINLKHLLSDVGIGITAALAAFVSALLFTETKLSTLWALTKKGFQADLKEDKKETARFEPRIEKEPPRPIFPPEKTSFLSPKKREPLPVSPLPVAKPFVPPKEEKKTESKRSEAIRSQRVANGEYSLFKLPTLSLLKNPKKVDLSSIKKDLRKQAERLEETLLSFGIEAKVGEIHCGPTITSFEVHPSVGVKVQKIKALENDIALNLQASSIRIIAPIPGKAAVGVEIPSLHPQEVNFKELLSEYQSGRKKFQIPILLGKSVSGEAVMSDLARMPHCIIAGATGSGKSVCINTIVMSIVMNARPDEIKLLMVDPKKVELTGYTNLPHMIAPVITEAHGALAALNWLVKEMQNRYEILKQLRLRNITAFNERTRDVEHEATLKTPVPEKMAMIVAIIDEFADLMMASSSDLETPIARIAQMARAVGIHMILATQRPSREVITGIIKANFPTRISFKVSSRINSQIVLDETGAESLLGNGDMLFLPPGTSQLIRAQGTYISDEEINAIVRTICEQAPPNYLIRSFDTMPKEDLDLLIPSEGGGEGKDSLYDEALSTVTQMGSASTTFLQRKLKIGYARAASLMDELEQNGIIGPQEGAKPRRVIAASSGLSEEE